MWRLELLQRSVCYLDSNVLIYAFEGEHVSPVRSRLAALFEECAEGRVRAFASVLVRAEILVRPLRDGNASLAAWYRELLSGQGMLAMLPLDAATADRAALLRAERPSLRLPDALHLAAAIHAGCDFFITGDLRLRGASGNRIRVLDTHELAARE